MNFVKKNYKLIIVIVIGAILISGISVYATGQYLASQVDYNKNGQANVSDALDDLYNKASNYKYTEQDYQDYGDERYSAGISANANSVANIEGVKTGTYQGTAKQSYWIDCGFQPRYIVISLETVGSTSNDAVFYYKEGISSSNSYMEQINSGAQTTYLMEGKNGTIANDATRHIYGVSNDGFGFYFTSSAQKIYYAAFK